MKKGVQSSRQKLIHQSNSNSENLNSFKKEHRITCLALFKTGSNVGKATIGCWFTLTIFLNPALGAAQLVPVVVYGTRSAVTHIHITLILTPSLAIFSIPLNI